MRNSQNHDHFFTTLTTTKSNSQALVESHAQMGQALSEAKKVIDQLIEEEKRALEDSNNCNTRGCSP